MMYLLKSKRRLVVQYLVLNNLYYWITKALLAMNLSLIRLSIWLLWGVSILSLTILQLQYLRGLKVTLVTKPLIKLCQICLSLLRSITYGLGLSLTYGRFKVGDQHLNKANYLAWMTSKVLVQSNRYHLISLYLHETWLMKMKTSETQLILLCLKAGLQVK